MSKGITNIEEENTAELNKPYLEAIQDALVSIRANGFGNINKGDFLIVENIITKWFE